MDWMGYSPQGHKECAMTEYMGAHAHTHTHTHTDTHTPRDGKLRGWRYRDTTVPIIP